MRHHVIAGLLSVILSQSATPARAQDIIRQQPCYHPGIKSQADSLTAILKDQGFRLLREASIQMESQYDMPVVMPLTQKQLYTIVFIGHPDSRLFELRLFDFSEAQVYYEKKLAGDEQANIISFPFVPETSNYYVLRPVQVQKKRKDLCGYVMIFRKP